MKTPLVSTVRACRKVWKIMILAACLTAPEARAQLAITELMSHAAPDTTGRPANPDWWELTNFGTNTIHLGGYLFSDANAPVAAQAVADGVHIAPRESIVFVRRDTSTPLDEAGFCAWWWGEANDCAALQILFYDAIGFARNGEELWLWDAGTNLVDSVAFGQAEPGVTFTFDLECGQFGALSESGVCGAFTAAAWGDIGSPGTAPCGPVPLRILRQPEDQAVDLGMDIILSVEACGLPQPRISWFKNGNLLAAASAAPGSFPTVVNYAGSGVAWKISGNPWDLAIPHAGAEDSGDYFAVLDNGLQRQTGGVATITINTSPLAPEIQSPPSQNAWRLVNGQAQTNLVLAFEQTAELAVLFRGYPRPAFQWSWSFDGANFIELAGATNDTLILPNAQPEHAGIYRVRMENDSGWTNAYASLTVKPAPLLKITEVLGSPSARLHPNWWELTNIGHEPVPLYGFRWDDAPGTIGAGPTITNQITIRPGESVLLIRNASPDAFIRWWGEENLPADVKIILYTANGFSSDGDEVTIWNPTAVRDDDFIDTVVFSMLPLGASLWFETELCPDSEFAFTSVAGECGAFVAAEGGDVGSPGWTEWTPPTFTTIRPELAGVRLEWRAQHRSVNLLQYTTRLAHPVSMTEWIDLGVYSFPGALGEAVDPNPPNAEQRFYRLVRMAPDGCPPCVESP
jgi:hypothetical protein